MRALEIIPQEDFVSHGCRNRFLEEMISMGQANGSTGVDGAIPFAEVVEIIAFPH